MTETVSFKANLSEPLIKACSDGRLKDVVDLLEDGADPNAPVEELGRNGLRKVFPMTATFRVLARKDSLPKMAQRQSERIITALTGAGARIRLVEREVLTHAIRMGVPEMLNFLVSNGARVHRYGHELMEMSLLGQKIDCAQMLKSLGVDPNVRDQWGSTTFLDICSGSLNMQFNDNDLNEIDPVKWFRHRFEELFDLGVKINISDTIGSTALMRSIVGNQEHIMCALLECGASLQPTMKNGVGALHLVAAGGTSERFKTVLRHVVDRSQIVRMKAVRLQPDIKAHLTFLASQLLVEQTIEQSLV